MRCHKNSGDPCKCCKEMSAQVDELADSLATVHKLVMEFMVTAAGQSEWGADQLRALLATPKGYRRFKRCLPHLKLPPMDDCLLDISQPQPEE